MDMVRRDELEEVKLPGRFISKAVGIDGPIFCSGMTVGFARYCEEAGPMEPHRHAEEIVYVVAADGRARFRCGGDKSCSDRGEELHAGDIVRFEEDEWHVFEYDAGGALEIIFFYGCAGNIRPEEKQSV